MSDIGSKKSTLILLLCLTLYVILGAILLFYVEQCSSGKANNPKTSTNSEVLTRKCEAFLKPTLNNGEVEETPSNFTVENCVAIMSQVLAAKSQVKGKKCHFSPRNYFPCLHHMIFSLLTIGGTRLPVTSSGQALVTVFTILGIFPVIRFFINSGMLLSQTTEHVILTFELKVLNRSPRMIHLLSRKVIFLQTLVVILYNVAIAWVTSSRFFWEKWTFWESFFFWLLAMTTTGHVIDTHESDLMFSNGSWRILTIDIGVFIGLLFVSGIVCSIVQCVHKNSCHASKTIKHAFETQKPEVYFEIKPLKSHL